MAPSNSLRVGIDGLNLALEHGAGVATYARTLSAALHHAGIGVDLLYGLDAPRRGRPAVREAMFFSALGGATPRRRRRRWSFAWSAAPVEIVPAGVVRDAFADRVPAADRVFNSPALFEAGARYFSAFGRFLPVTLPDPPDVMHWTYPVPLRVRGARNLYTVHDLVPLKLPFTTLDDRAYHDRLLRGCVRFGDGLCTVSETSRTDILAHLPVAPERVVNTYQAVTTPGAVDPAGSDEKRRRLFGLEPDGYLLFFGAVEPKKNLDRLLEAYLSSGVTTPLVLAGPHGWMSRGQLRLIEGARRAPGADRVRRLGWLPAGHLRLLVRGARAVLFPSLYEGFGLPAVEAMAQGAPLLASTGGALPEVTGGAALLVDPYDVEAMARALARLDADPALRDRLRAAGPERARAFALPSYAARLQGLYADLLSRDAPAHATRPARAPSAPLLPLPDPSS